MVKIRKNMEQLEIVIAACAQQLSKLQVVDSRLIGTVATLKQQLFTEEKRILDGIIAAVKEAQKAGKM